MSELPTGISRRTIQVRSLLIMVGVVLLVTLVAIWQLYTLSMQQAQEELRSIARAQATLIEAVAKYDAIHANEDGGSRARTISQIRSSSMKFREFGQTGEIAIAERREGQVHFLMPERSLGYRLPKPVTFGADNAGPMQNALNGSSGIVQAFDFRGVEVLGAYEYLPFLDIGLVVKMDVAEIRAPFIRVLSITGIVALVLLFIGMRLHAAVVGPLLRVVFRRSESLASGLKSAGAASERYATVFRAASDPIIIEDLEGRVLEVNRAAEERYGWSADQLVGRSIKVLMPPELHAKADEWLERCLRGEEVRDVEGLRVTRQGDLRHVLFSLSALKDENGQIMAVSSVAKDITDLREARHRLEEYSRSLEQQVAARTEALEHELRVAKTLAAEARRGYEFVLLGDSLEVQTLRAQVERHAQELTPLLLGGPGGAGQESVARAIHERSPRAEKPFIMVDCSRPMGEDSTPMLGLSTGGSEDGAVAVAAGGTLYLEQVEQLSLALQEQMADLLERAVRERAAGRVPEPDMRVIAYSTPEAANSLSSAQLHPRLASLLRRNRLSVPALSERRQDVEPLATRLLTERARATGKAVAGFTDRALAKLRDYDWPGNLRELQAVIERVLLHSVGTLVDIEEDLRQNARTIGGYRLMELIGRGGMGEVWLGEHALLKRPAAIKLTQRGADLTPEDREMLERRFQREASVTAQLRSPHTVELYDFGVTAEGQFYYVMQFLEGLPLAALAEREGTLPPERAIHLMRQACLSLAEAHATGLVHRDIKPENLFVCRHVSEVDFVKVLDFGVVKLEKEKGTAATKTGMLVGTPAYLSPELASGQTATAASDIYALGCVLYRLVTGRLVFEADSIMEMVVAHGTAEPEPPSKHAPQPIPAALDALILECLSKDPAARPGSAMELRRRLAEIETASPWTEERAYMWWASQGASRFSSDLHSDPTMAAITNLMSKGR